MRGRFFSGCDTSGKPEAANSDCEAPQKTRKDGRGFLDVTRPELKVHGMPIFIPTLHVRKTDNGKTGREVPNRPLECATRD